MGPSLFTRIAAWLQSILPDTGLAPPLFANILWLSILAVVGGLVAMLLWLALANARTSAMRVSNADAEESDGPAPRQPWAAACILLAMGLLGMYAFPRVFGKWVVTSPVASEDVLWIVWAGVFVVGMIAAFASLPTWLKVAARFVFGAGAAALVMRSMVVRVWPTDPGSVLAIVLLGGLLVALVWTMLDSIAKRATGKWESLFTFGVLAVLCGTASGTMMLAYSNHIAFLILHMLAIWYATLAVGSLLTAKLGKPMNAAHGLVAPAGVLVPVLLIMAIQFLDGRLDARVTAAEGFTAIAFGTSFADLHLRVALALFGSVAVAWMLRTFWPLNRDLQTTGLVQQALAGCGQPGRWLARGFDRRTFLAQVLMLAIVSTIAGGAVVVAMYFKPPPLPGLDY